MTGSTDSPERVRETSHLPWEALHEVQPTEKDGGFSQCPVPTVCQMPPWKESTPGNVTHDHRHAAPPPTVWNLSRIRKKWREKRAEGWAGPLRPKDPL